MKITRTDFRIIGVAIACGVLAWFLLRMIGAWVGTPIEAIEDESTSTGGAIAVLATIWQYIQEGEREDNGVE